MKQAHVVKSHVKFIRLRLMNAGYTFTFNGVADFISDEMYSNG